MAKKLTNEVLEKLVMESIEEMGDVNEILGAIKNWAMGGSKPASTPFGRKARPPKSGGASESEAVQLLQLIASDPKVPNNIKSQIADFLEYAPSTPEMKTDTDWDLEEVPTANVTQLDPTGEEPTVKLTTSVYPTAKGTGFSYSSPRATSGPTKGRIPAPSLTPAKKKVAESKIEALVAEVLAEMSKKKEEPKQPKKPVKK